MNVTEQQPQLMPTNLRNAFGYDSRLLSTVTFHIGLLRIVAYSVIVTLSLGRAMLRYSTEKKILKAWNGIQRSLKVIDSSIIRLLLLYGYLLFFDCKFLPIIQNFFQP